MSDYEDYKINRLLDSYNGPQTINEGHLKYFYHYDKQYCIKHYNSFGPSNCIDNPNCFAHLFSLHEKMNESKVIDKEMGGNPSENLKAEEQPMGLKNLGATCYMNSVLQVLNYTPNFVENLTGIPYDCDPLCRELQLLFGYLSLGLYRSFIPTDVAIKLELDVSIQQDVQEFYLLLLSFFEETLKKIKMNKNLISGIFEGTMKYIMTCTSCNNNSTSKGKFLHLSLAIDNIYSLEEAISKMYKPEEVLGYDCDNCKKPTSATRKQVIEELPNVLTIQLNRFVYDVHRGIRKKLTHDVRFYDELVIENQKYVLYAVIVHLGSSATGGHYIAYVQDKEKIWWKADDSNVSQVQSPFNLPNDQTPYLLLYKKYSYHHISKPTFPKVIHDIVSDKTNEYIREYDSFSTKREEIISTLIREKEFKKSILEILPTRNHESEYYWISNDWLTKWISRDPNHKPTINNYDLKCEHGKLRLDNISLIRKISKSAWEKLDNVYGGGPILNQFSLCHECVAKKLEVIKVEKILKNKKQEILKRLHGHFYYMDKTVRLSKKWVNEWKNTDINNENKLNPDWAYDITCPHQKLIPNCAGTVEAPIEVVNTLKDRFPNSPGKQFSIEDECQECKELQKQNEEDIKLRKNFRDREKNLLKELYNFITYSHISTGNVDRGTYIMVDKSWLLNWVSYIDGSSMDNIGVPRNESLLCVHNKIPFSLNNLKRKPKTRPYMLLEQYAWDKLKNSYPDAGPTIPVHVESYDHSSRRYKAYSDHGYCEECYNKYKSEKEEKFKKFTNEKLQVKEDSIYSRDKGVSIGCSYNTTVMELKLLICQYMDIDPCKQRLKWNSKELGDDSKTLEFYGVTPKKPITIERKDPGSSDVLMSEPVGKEIGFQGTKLQKSPRMIESTAVQQPVGWSCSKCTFLNEDPNSTVCFMCEDRKQ